MIKEILFELNKIYRFLYIINILLKLQIEKKTPILNLLKPVKIFIEIPLIAELLN